MFCCGEFDSDRIVREQKLYDVRNLGRELSYKAVSRTASTFRARKDLLPQGIRYLQRQPVGGLQELTHDGMLGSLSCVGPDRFEPSMALSQAIEGTYVSMLTLGHSGR